jgi:hypothetical protein
MRDATKVVPDRIVELGYGFRAAKVLMSAVELGVFAALAGGPLRLDVLTNQLKIDLRGARDFLDALVALQLLDRDEEGRYSNSSEADLYLDSNKTTYIGGLLEHISRSEYPRWDSLTTALTTGRSQTASEAGGNYPTNSADETRIRTFVRGMTGASLSAARVLAQRFRWSDYSTCIDVGTAQGCVPVAIARQHPHMRGGGFDLPTVGPMFEKYVAEHGLSDRLSFYSGDFLTEPLPAADVLIMGRVLHNWDLSTKHMLLQKAYAALTAGGALIVYERLIDDARRANTAGLLSSLNMLVMTPGGFDFTGADCIGWMHDAGFRKMRIEALTTDQSMIIAYK